VIIHKKLTNTSISIYQSPKKGEVISGDAYFIHETDDYLIVGLVDGLGSGTLANEAAMIAVESIKLHHESTVDVIIHTCNQSLYQTRGVVAGVMKLCFKTSKIYFAGLGNINLILYSGGPKASRSISTPGYLNGRPIKIRVEMFEYKENTPFLMHTDGFRVHRDLASQIQLHSEPRESMNVILEELIQTLDDDTTFIVGKSNF